MATFVLVPGAWLGGWAWQEVTGRLRAAGHDVYPVTLTGLGERVHLARPDTDLETHITDVANTITVNDLDEVILAGHSYAGAVLPGIADRLPDRLSQLVYVDSAPLPNGMALADLFGPEGRAGLQQTVDEFGDGWLLPFPGFDALAEDTSLAGIDDEAKLRMEAKAEPQPWQTYTQPLRLEHQTEPAYSQVVIACDDVRNMVAAGVEPILPLTRPPWRYIEIETGHWPMFSAPDELAAALDGLTTG